MTEDYGGALAEDLSVFGGDWVEATPANEATEPVETAPPMSLDYAAANSNEDKYEVMQRLHDLADAMGTQSLFHCLVDMVEGIQPRLGPSFEPFVTEDGKLLPEVKAIIEQYYPTKRELFSKDRGIARMYAPPDEPLRSHHIPDQEQRKAFVKALKEVLDIHAPEQPEISYDETVIPMR